MENNRELTLYRKQVFLKQDEQEIYTAFPP